MPVRQLQFVMLVLLVALAGCQSIRPETPREGIYAFDNAIEQAAIRLEAAHAAGYVSDEQKEKAAERLRQALTIADAAREYILSGNEEAGRDGIARASDILQTVTELLEDFE